jgi:chromosome partitioning protein
MIVTVLSSKGGVGKTTTAVHLAAYLQTLKPTLLLDDDKTRNATAWSRRGSGLPFKVASTTGAARLGAVFTHVVADTGQASGEDTVREAAEQSELVVIPAKPSALDTDGLGQTIRTLQSLGAANFKVLLTMVAPDAAGAAAELRGLLREMNVPVFRAEIPRLKAFEKAAGLGLIVRDVKDENAARAWAAYVAAGKELRA